MQPLRSITTDPSVRSTFSRTAPAFFAALGIVVLMAILQPRGKGSDLFLFLSVAAALVLFFLNTTVALRALCRTFNLGLQRLGTSLYVATFTLTAIYALGHARFPSYASYQSNFEEALAVIAFPCILAPLVGLAYAGVVLLVLWIAEGFGLPSETATHTPAKTAD